jgi:hypothetical protein
MKVTVTIDVPKELMNRVIAVAPNRKQTPEQFIANAAIMGIEMYVEEEEAHPTVEERCVKCGTPIFVFQDDKILWCDNCWANLTPERRDEIINNANDKGA